MNAPDSVVRHLRSLGFSRLGDLHYQLTPPELYEAAIRRGEARLVADGPLAARTDPHTGRSPGDRFVVDEPSSKQHVGWGKTNKPLSEGTFGALLKGMNTYAVGRPLFIRDCYAGADPRYQVKVRVVTEKAWHSLFATNMFLRPATVEELEGFQPDFTVVDLCDFNAPT
ncbi:MAG TPA: phosphoenolpyruvate carboxykinase (ATP), partial [Rhodothermales bacterium]|nr:phosphoenolpyruvate carboxykinase (ATP) [Rhodothermales bacterium]